MSVPIATRSFYIISSLKVSCCKFLPVWEGKVEGH